jgi:DNA-binding CsgD family transcriptional regulator
MGDHISGGRTDERRGGTHGVDVPVRRLLGDLAAIGVTAPHHADSELDGIFLDVEVDGVRCVLIRCPPLPARNPLQALSPRENEIARMVARGYANKTIASVLDISSWTVSSHLRRIYTKLGVGSRAAMVARLFELDRDGDRALPTQRRPPGTYRSADDAFAPLHDLQQVVARGR